MVSNYSKRAEKTDSKHPKQKRNKEKLMILSKCAICDTKKLRFIKEQKVSGLLSSLKTKTSLNQIFK